MRRGREHAGDRGDVVARQPVHLQEALDNLQHASRGAPDCAAVWKDEGQLPRSYKGCNSDEGFVATDTLGCSSGQRMVRYGDHFYAVFGGMIHETESLLEDDRGYRAAVASCRA